MVVDDIERHGKVLRVRRVYELLQIVWCAVTILGCKREGAVVPPVAGSGKLRDGHQLNRGYTEVGDTVEVRNDCDKSAFRCERADVKLVEDAVFERRCFPTRVRPVKRGRIDNLRRAVNALWLKAGRRIWPLGIAIESIKIF